MKRVLKAFLPKNYVTDVYSINYQAFRDRGFCGIIFDVDNTLEDHLTERPSSRCASLLRQLGGMGFRLCLLSNNSPARAERFADGFDVWVVGKAGKPSAKGYCEAMRRMGTHPEQTLMVGDQIFTDIWGANRVGIYSILVEPIQRYENGFFYVKRFLERFVMRRY